MNNSETSVCLIRHGEVHNRLGLIYGRTIDGPLSPEGYRQITSLAHKLKMSGISPDIIVTSPLLRARQSSNAIHDVFLVTPIVLSRNLMDTNEPILANKTIQWLKSVGGDEYALAEYKDQIERPEVIANRMLKVFKKLTSAFRNKTIFIVSHGDPITFLAWKLQHF